MVEGDCLWAALAEPEEARVLAAAPAQAALLEAVDAVAREEPAGREAVHYRPQALDPGPAKTW